MSATAKLLKDSGVTVTGSDEHVYPPVSQFLADQALSYKTPYAAENIPDGVDLIVIGKNAKLVPETNPEVAAAIGSGLFIVSRQAATQPLVPALLSFDESAAQQAAL